MDKVVRNHVVHVLDLKEIITSLYEQIKKW